jgi:hypothetical protein
MNKYYVSMVIPVLLCVEANNETHAEVKAQSIVEQGIDEHWPFVFFNKSLPTRSMVTNISQATKADDPEDDNINDYGNGETPQHD